MSSVEEEPPTASPDQGATGERATSIPLVGILPSSSHIKTSTEQTPEDRIISEREYQEMISYHNTMMENIQKCNPVQEDVGLPPNLDKDKNYSVYYGSSHSTTSESMHPSVSVLRKIGDHVGAIHEAIAANRDGNNINTIEERKVTALASYIQQVAKEAQETTKETKATDTGDEEGSWRREKEEVYPLRVLIFLFILVSVSFIILIIIGIISLTWQTD